MKFGPMHYTCPICKKDRRKGYHEPCSKKLQEEAKGKAPRRLLKKLPEAAVNYLGKTLSKY